MKWYRIKRKVGKKGLEGFPPITYARKHDNETVLIFNGVSFWKYPSKAFMAENYDVLVLDPILEQEQSDLNQKFINASRLSNREVINNEVRTWIKEKL